MWRHYRKGAADTKQKREEVSVPRKLRSQWDRQMWEQINQTISERDVCWGDHRQNNLRDSGLLFFSKEISKTVFWEEKYWIKYAVSNTKGKYHLYEDILSRLQSLNGELKGIFSDLVKDFLQLREHNWVHTLMCLLCSRHITRTDKK